MKIIDMIKISLLNIRSNLKMILGIWLGFVIVVEMIMLSAGYGYAINSYIRDSVLNNYSNAYCNNISTELSEQQRELFENDSRIEGIQTLKIYDYSEYCNDSGQEIEEKVTLDYAIMKIDGKTYSGKNDFTYDFDVDNPAVASRTDKFVNLNIGIMEPEKNLLISECEIKEYENKYHTSNPFIQGNVFSRDKQLLISDYMLDKFGVDMELSDCIGQKVSIYIKTDNAETLILRDYEISGILNQNFFRINSRKRFPQIILSNEVEHYTRVSRQRVYGKSFRDIMGFFSDNTTEDHLMINESANQYSEIQTQQILFDDVVVVISAILILALVVFIYTIIYFYFRKRMRYVCVQRAIGMNERTLFGLIFCELFIVGMVAYVSATIIYYQVIDVLNEIMHLSIGDDFCISDKVIVLASGSAFLFEILLMLIIAVIQYFQTRKYTVVQREKFM